MPCLVRPADLNEVRTKHAAFRPALFHNCLA
jgi:hypothetical protein